MTFEELQKKIHIEFTDKKLFHLAFVHRSYLNEDRSEAQSNERLEFLGDAVLSFLTSHYLYSTYPDFPEGKLTNIRSSLVNTKSLGAIASQLSLGELLFLSKGEQEGGGRTNPSLLADVFEALLGAIYLDLGLDSARTFLEMFLFTKTKEIIENKTYLDFKSNLQEVIQERLRVSPVYSVTRSEGPDHQKTFWVQAKAGDMVLGEGKGKSKQEAEQEAAHIAIERLAKQ